MTTAEEWRAKAAAAENNAAESFERCDTDGFVTQWASGVTASQYRLQAEITENGGWELQALFDLDGNLLAAKELETAYGWSWGILENDDPSSRIVKWFNPSKAATPEKRRVNNAKKGIYVGTIKTDKVKAELGGSGTGLSGALSVRAYVRRTDGGFSRDVEIIDNGQES